jgi:hypothetical protein
MDLDKNISTIFLKISPTHLDTPPPPWYNEGSVPSSNPVLKLTYRLPHGILRLAELPPSLAV